MLFTKHFFRRIITVLLFSYSILILYGTLKPFNFTVNSKILATRSEPIEWVPFSYVCPSCGYNIKNKVINLFMLIPFGFLLLIQCNHFRQIIHKLLLTTVTGFCLSLSIEVTQYFLPQRTPSMSDVLMNSIGAWIGAVIALAFIKWISASSKEIPKLLQETLLHED